MQGAGQSWGFIMYQGWIKLHRKLLDKAFSSKPFYLALWVHLLLLANHSGKEFIWNGKTVRLKEGQFITGRKTLSENTGIPESTVERILSFFEKERQIEQQKTTKYRLITILKWDTHQILDNKRTTSGQQVDTNKNVKNEKKNISEQSSGSLIPLGKKDMSFKNMRKYNEDGHYEEPSIDADLNEPIEPLEEKLKAEERELNAKIRANLKLVEPVRGIPFGIGKDMNFHVKIYRELLNAGWSHKGIIASFLEVIESDHWKQKKQQGEYPGMNTVQFHLRNKKPI